MGVVAALSTVPTPLKPAPSDTRRTQQVDTPALDRPAKVAEPDRTSIDALGLDLETAAKPAAPPWHVRNSRWLIAGAIGTALVTFTGFAFVAWRSLGPSPLDEITITSPSKKDSDMTPAQAPISTSKPSPPSTLPANRTDNVQTSAVSKQGSAEARPSTATKASPGKSGPVVRGVTHTNPRDAAPTAPTVRAAAPEPAVTEPRSANQTPAAQTACTEAVAALGLCASQSGK
jgi:hypothetical protein